jgi:hypothetical protein
MSCGYIFIRIYKDITLWIGKQDYR